MIRVAIVDDEPVARRTVRILLEAEEDFEIVGECDNGKDAIALLEDIDVDVVFLDIQMPGAPGFEVLSRVPSEATPLVVFVTAYDEHAVRAFEVSAVDYLLKPFDDDRFGAAVARIRERVAERRISGLVPEFRELANRIAHLQEDVDSEPPSTGDGASTGDRSDFADRIAVRLGKKIEFVDTAAIDWIEAEDYCVRLHVADRSYVIRETLTRLESALDPAEFVRVHRSAIVRIARVRQLVSLDHGDGVIVLDDETRIRVSRTRRRRVNAILGLR